MDFINRLKKEMSEGIVRAMLEHAGYFVKDHGVEKTIPGLSCLTEKEYTDLGIPDATRFLTDFIVRNRDHTGFRQVEVKYRTTWGIEVFHSCRDQVAIHDEIILVTINANANDPNEYNGASRFLRCCRLRMREGNYEAELRYPARLKKPGLYWQGIDSIVSDAGLWWRLSPMAEYFPLLKEQDSKHCLRASIDAISGILDSKETPAKGQTPAKTVVTPSEDAASAEVVG